MSTVAEAIARHKAAQAAYDAAKPPDGVLASDALDELLGELCEAEMDACDELVEAPCANDAEFIEKLRCLVKRETRLFGSPFESSAEFVLVARAAAAYFEGSGEDKMLGA